jgi:competence protein ComEA
MLLKRLFLFFVVGFLALNSFAEENQVQVPKVNINTADAEELETLLNGIGKKKAAAIVKFREENGLFKIPEDLMKVPGIREKTFNKNKDLIIVSETKAESDTQLVECEEESSSSEENQPSEGASKTDSVAGAESSENAEKTAIKKPLCKKSESAESPESTSESPKSTTAQPVDDLTSPKSDDSTSSKPADTEGDKLTTTPDSPKSSPDSTEQKTQ